MAKKHPALNRPVSACQRCRAAKLGCDRSKPRCSRCARVGGTCTYYSSPIHSPGGNLFTGANTTSLFRDAESSRAPEVQSHRTPSASPPPERPHIPNKRDRAIISCARCRKHKARCDRRTPCGRCARLNKGSECVYSGGGSAGSSSTLPDRTKTIATTYIDRQWSRRFRTRPHWTTLLQEVGRLPPRGGVAELTT